MIGTWPTTSEYWTCSVLTAASDTMLPEESDDWLACPVWMKNEAARMSPLASVVACAWPLSAVPGIPKYVS
ncbi:MAG TPA: hypothetical protein PKV98_14660 [Burkholderiaceae bacterium]|nr:hypothetical protein [Burkholderiaceae bacterium]